MDQGAGGRLVARCAWVGMALALAACGGGEGDAKPEGSAARAPAAAVQPGAAATGAQPTIAAEGNKAAPGTPAPAAAPQAVTSPEMQSYPMGSIKPIPDNCSNAHVILANAPSTVGVDYPWAWSKQAMLANQQFKTGSSATAPGQVSFAVHQADATMAEAFALVATCGDGSTCNRLAAMYKAVVKSSNPQPLCGALPKALGRPKKQIDLLAGDPASHTPKAGDTIGMCARIAACTIATKPDTTDDVGIACQKRPGDFKTACASKYPCAEVMACLGQ
jgi:hypothetical protein